VDEVLHRSENIGFIGPEEVVIGVSDANDSRLRNLDFEGICLVLHVAQEDRGMGNVKDGENWEIDVRIFLLSVEDCHTDGVAYGMRRRHERKIFLSLLKFLFKLTDFGKQLINLFWRSGQCP